MKHDVLKKYNLPEEVRFCKKCVISNQRPRITFDNNGICSACNFAEAKHDLIDWDARDTELRQLCDKHRKSNGEYDVIVPCSGGKDGSFVAHQLKYKYGMNPLTVTWAPLVQTDIGRKNLTSFINAGFDNILGTPNGAITRKLCQLASVHLGDPFQPFIYGQYNFPLKMAVKHNVSLIMYGENGEVEYGGDMKYAMLPKREIVDQDATYFSGKPPEFWTEHGVSENDLAPFKGPTYRELMENETEIHFFGYYKCWDPQENFYYCQEHVGFETNEFRSEGTYSKYASLDDKIDGFHYYLMFIKFGFGRATSDAAHEVRDGKITREEAVALVKKYDGEFPQKNYDLFLEYSGLTDAEFNNMIDSWRSEHIWEQIDGQWSLKNAVWKD